MPVTLKDIAKRTGLSLQTVSQCIRDDSPKLALYSPETRDRVRRAAAELQYRPNSSAKAIANGRFRAVSLVLSIDPVRSSVFGGLLCGLHDALSEANLQLTVSRLSDSQLSDPRTMPMFLREQCCDGLLINYTDKIPAGFVEIIRKHQLPAIWINSAHEHDCVFLDDAAAANRATAHLLSLGHRRVAYVDCSHGPAFVDPHYSSVARRRGYLQAMKAAGLSPRVLAADSGENVPPLQRVAWLRQVLALPDRPTAVLAYNAKDATSLYVAATSAGLNVPGDLSLICFSERSISHLGPEFAIVRLAEEEMGKSAVQMLVQKIAAPAVRIAPRPIDMELLTGETVAPAPAL